MPWHSIGVRGYRGNGDGSITLGSTYLLPGGHRKYQNNNAELASSEQNGSIGQFVVVSSSKMSNGSSG